jgi:hypothetical protein
MENETRPQVINMKRTIVRITVFILSMSASSIVLSPLSIAQFSRNQDGPTPPPEKTVDQVFKNIKVLNGLPQSKLYPTMRFMAASLGVQCGNCHVIRNGVIDAPADEKPEKETARQMIKMVIEINKMQFQENPMVSCYTCHCGHRTPQGVPSLPLPMPSPRVSNPPSGVTASSPMPSAVDVLNKYLAAIGGQAATDRVTSCVIKGTTSTAVGQIVDYETEQAAPDKGHEAFALKNIPGRNCAGDSRCEYERVLNGRQGWLRSGGGIQDLVGEQLADQKLTFPLFSILKLKAQYTSFRFVAREQIDDRDVYVLSAVRLDGKSERLYFDAEIGLLRRRISYLRTLIAMIPQQTDYEDYREIDGLKLPFTITMSYVDAGSRPIIRKFREIKLNIPVPESKFEKPQ